MVDCDEFTKRWDNERGFTLEEALAKAEKVRKSYGDENWEPPKIERDDSKPKGGYKVIIKRKPKPIS